MRLWHTPIMRCYAAVKWVATRDSPGQQIVNESPLSADEVETVYYYSRYFTFVTVIFSQYVVMDC